MSSPGGNDVEIRVIVRDLASRTMSGIAAGARGMGSAAGSAAGPLGSVVKGLAGISAASGAVSTIGGLGTALATAAPAALILPGALLAGAAAMQTFKLATDGFGEAIAAADPAAFAEATKDMAPAAVEAASAVRDLRPAFDDLRRSVQGEFFRGFATQIERTGTVLMPILQTGLSGIAGAMGEMGRQAVEAMRNPFFQDDLTAILENTRGAFVGMEGSVADLVSGFVGLGGVGSTYLPALGEAIGDVARRFREWVDSGVEDGSIQEMIDRALVALRQLGEVAANVGGILSAVFRGLAGGEDFSVFLDGLVELSAALREALNTEEAQAALGALGEAMRAVSGAMGEVLIAALTAVFPLISALAPVVVALAEAFQASLVDSGLIATVGTLLTSLVTALVDSGLLDAFVQLAGVVGGALATALIALSPVLVEIATAFGEFLTGAITQLVDSGLLDRLVAVITRVLLAVLPLIPQILELALAAFPLFVAGAEAALPVLEFLAGAIEGCTPIVQGLIDILSLAAAALTGDFDTMKEKTEGFRTSIRDKLDGVAGFFRDLPGKIRGFLAGLPGILADSGRRMIDSFADGIRRAFNGAVAAVQVGLGAVRRLFPFSPAKEGPFSGSGYVDRSGEALVGDFAAAIRAGLPDVVGAARDVLGGAQVALGVSLPAVALPGGPGVPQQAAPPASSAAGGGVLRVELVVGGGASGAFADLLMRMQRSGELQLQVASA